MKLFLPLFELVDTVQHSLFLFILLTVFSPDTDLRLHLPAVLEGSARGVGCAGMGRSEPREQLLPLGGTLSLYWWKRGSMQGCLLTGHCADGLFWKSQTANKKKIYRCKIQTQPSLLCTTPIPSISSLNFLKSFCSPVFVSLCVFFLSSPLGDYWEQQCTAVEQSRVEVGKERRIL